MAEYNVLQEAAVVQNQRRTLRMALQIFANHGRITALTVTEPREVERARAVSFITEQMTYPPQMVDAIVAFLRHQVDELTKQLEDLGVTDIDYSDDRIEQEGLGIAAGLVGDGGLASRLGASPAPKSRDHKQGR